MLQKFSLFALNWNCLNASTNGIPSMSPIVPPSWKRKVESISGRKYYYFFFFKESTFYRFDKLLDFFFFFYLGNPKFCRHALQRALIYSAYFLWKTKQFACFFILTLHQTHKIPIGRCMVLWNKHRTFTNF